MTIQHDEVRRQLERIVASRVFVRSERMSRFLRFVVEETLSGRGASLKESVVAVQVFDRGSTHDPSSDPIVRVEARRLRSKLEDYYAGPGAHDALLIRLPKGSYTPEFEQAHVQPFTSGAQKSMLVSRLAAVVLVAGAWIALIGVRRGTAAASSVAVLPFQDLSEGKNLGYFCDGLTEQLIFVLSRTEGLRVPGRTSSFQFREPNEDLKALGSKLKVDHIVRGSVRGSGGRLRITTLLLSTETGYTLWSQTYEGEPGALFALEDEISLAVSRALRVHASSKAARKPAENSEALRLYLEGRLYWYANDFGKSADFFQRSVGIDPGFAMAHAGLARAYSRMESRQIPFLLGEAAALRALELDPTLAEALVSLAVMKVRQWDWVGAEREFRRALQVDSRSAEAHGEYAIGFLAPIGRIEEALRESALSLDLDPLSPFENIRHGVLLMYARRLAESESQLRKAYALSPEYARRHLGRLLLVMGRYPEALEMFSGNPVWTAITLARQGRQNAATGVSIAGSSDPYSALYWAAIGNQDKALAVLEAGARSNSAVLTTLNSPLWDRLRSDPRFPALLQRIGLHGAR